MKEEQLTALGVSCIGHRKAILKQQATLSQALVRPRDPPRLSHSYVSGMLDSWGIKKEFIIPYEQLELQGQIGRGSFGEVYRGKWLGQSVAVKLKLPSTRLDSCLR